MLYLKLQCQFKTWIIREEKSKHFLSLQQTWLLAFLCWRAALMFVLILGYVKFGIMYNGVLENLVNLPYVSKAFRTLSCPGEGSYHSSSHVGSRKSRSPSLSSSCTTTMWSNEIPHWINPKGAPWPSLV